MILPTFILQNQFWILGPLGYWVGYPVGMRPTELSVQWEAEHAVVPFLPRLSVLWLLSFRSFRDSSFSTHSGLEAGLSLLEPFSPSLGLSLPHQVHLFYIITS